MDQRAMGAPPDIHGVSSPTAGGSPYAADGRLDYTSATRNNTLDVFNNTNPNGSWTLYFGDLAPVNESTLTSWSLGITSVVPEPANVALGVFGAVFALLQLGRSFSRSKMDSRRGPPLTITRTLRAEGALQFSITHELAAQQS